MVTGSESVAVLGGRYELLGSVDTQTLAKIRVARDRVLDRTVFVKISRTNDELPAGLLEREARMAAALEHPHLLPIYDYGVIGNGHYLVMRHFDGTLREHLEQEGRGLQLQEAVALFRQLAAAVDFLHSRGIVHSNLKPENIVLDRRSGPGMHAFISDFGVAAIGRPGIGTPTYMSPEQFAGETATAASDIFTLGLVLYECLTGTRPSNPEIVSTLFMERLNPPEGLYSARRVRPELPVGFDVVLSGFTQLAPKDRYTSALAGLEELERTLYVGRATIEGSVFVSYARDDAAYVSELCRRLRDFGIRVWSDRDIPSGANWDQSVEDALQSADKMLVVLSPAATRSVNVQDEWSYFLEEGKAVYPMLYQPCDLPFRLRRRQHTRCTGDLLVDIARLVESLSMPSKTADADSER